MYLKKIIFIVAMCFLISPHGFAGGKSLTIEIPKDKEEYRFDMDNFKNRVYLLLYHIVGIEQVENYQGLRLHLRKKIRGLAHYYNYLEAKGQQGKAGDFLGRKMLPVMNLFSFLHGVLQGKLDKCSNDKERSLIKSAIQEMSELPDKNFFNLITTE